MSLFMEMRESLQHCIRTFGLGRDVLSSLSCPLAVLILDAHLSTWVRCHQPCTPVEHSGAGNA